MAEHHEDVEDWAECETGTCYIIMRVQDLG
jgi:hypothetical protein